MQGILNEDIIEIDGAGSKLEHQNPKFGKTVSVVGCTQAGVYGREENSIYSLQYPATM